MQVEPRDWLLQPPLFCSISSFLPGEKSEWSSCPECINCLPDRLSRKSHGLVGCSAVSIWSSGREMPSTRMSIASAMQRQAALLRFSVPDTCKSSLRLSQTFILNWQNRVWYFGPWVERRFLGVFLIHDWKYLKSNFCFAEEWLCHLPVNNRVFSSPWQLDVIKQTDVLRFFYKKSLVKVRGLVLLMHIYPSAFIFLKNNKLRHGARYHSWEKQIQMAGKIFINFVLKVLEKVLGIRHSTQHAYPLFPSALILSSAFILYPNSFPLSEVNRGISEIPLSQSCALRRLSCGSPSRKNTDAEYSPAQHKHSFVFSPACFHGHTHTHI